MTDSLSDRNNPLPAPAIVEGKVCVIAIKKRLFIALALLLFSLIFPILYISIMTGQKIWLRAETKPAEARSACESPSMFNWRVISSRELPANLFYS